MKTLLIGSLVCCSLLFGASQANAEDPPQGPLPAERKCSGNAKRLVSCLGKYLSQCSSGGGTTYIETTGSALGLTCERE